MRNFLGIVVVGSYLLGLPLPAFAKDDPNYNATQNLRPQNITGLGGIYEWVASYYNATTQVDLIVEKGRNATMAPCTQLQNQTLTMHWDSALAGSNSVNIMLTLIPPNYNKSHLNLWSTDSIFEPLWWALSSTGPTWSAAENDTVRDYYNFTTTKLSDSFSLAGTLFQNANTGYGVVGYPDILMPMCNSRTTTHWLEFSYKKPTIKMSTFTTAARRGPLGSLENATMTANCTKTTTTSSEVAFPEVFAKTANDWHYTGLLPLVGVSELWDFMIPVRSNMLQLSVFE